MPQDQNQTRTGFCASSPLCATGRFGLSVKLLALTTLFVLIAEVFIYVPSIANFRNNWLKDRISAAQTAALVIEAAPDGMLPKELEEDVLQHVGAMAISLKSGGARRLLAVSGLPPEDALTVDLRDMAPLTAIRDAFDTLFAGRERVIRIIGQPPKHGDFIEVTLSETPLRVAMLKFSRNILVLSLVISMMTASLVYIALSSLFVRPMLRLSQNMMAFRAAPQDAARIITPSGRADEIGQAEHELGQLQAELQATLNQSSRLAALGLAVAKINHDLRNILASLQLFADRLSASPDPTAQRIIPKVLKTLDRGIKLCQDTLAYGKVVEPVPERKLFALHPLVDEIGTLLGLDPDGRIHLRNAVPAELMIDGDPDQIFRVLLNLARNAVQALEGHEDNGPQDIRIMARREGSVSVIEVSDTGPGIAPAAKEKLFQAFGASTRGGSGLGLAIASELLKAHGGTIELAEGTLGACFRLAIPDRPVDLSARRVAKAQG